LISFATDEGSSTGVDGDPTVVHDLTYGFLRECIDATVLPVHSHPIEYLSSRDEKTLRTWAKFNLNYAIVVTPTTIKGYYTDTNGKITKIPITVIDDSRFPEKYKRKFFEYAEELTKHLKEKPKEVSKKPRGILDTLFDWFFE
jgi:hypothetical protein